MLDVGFITPAQAAEARSAPVLVKGVSCK